MKYVKLIYTLYQFKRNEKKSRAEILQLQEQKLRKILVYAFTNSPYYHQAFSAVGITKDTIQDLPLAAFPKITKEIFIKNFDQIVTDTTLTQEKLQAFDQEIKTPQSTFQQKYHVVHSSGSTGKPAYYVYDSLAWQEMLGGILRGALWDMKTFEIVKLLVKGPKIAYIAATDGRYGGAMAVSAGIEGIHAKQVFLDINLPVSKWIETISVFQPNIMIGYPSAIKILATLVEKKEVNVNLTRVIVCGEPLPTSLRKYLEKVLQTTIINIYGASESLAIGVESSSKEGMYLFEDMNYVEVENGNMYLTSLYNFTQPLIRYKLSDRLLMKESEKSRYPFMRIASILGRDEDILWFENAQGYRDFLHPLAIEGFTFESMLDYQFHQIDARSFEMFIQANNLLKRDEIENYMHKQMKKILNSKNLEFVEFKVRFVRKIYPDKITGKKRLIIKENKYECF